MNEHQDLAIRALVALMGDDTARARAAFSIRTAYQMHEQYGQSGKTCAQILAEYEAHDAKVQAAIDWVRAQRCRAVCAGPALEDGIMPATQHEMTLIQRYANAVRSRITEAEIMMKVEDKCPKCGCQYWNRHGFRTADAYSAWKDSDGNWYCGPAHEDITKSCAHCGWSQHIHKKRGKTIAVERDKT